MSMSSLSWITAAGASIIAHLGLAGLLTLTVDPKPVEQQTRPETRIELASYRVRTDRLTSSDAAGQDTNAVTPDAPTTPQGAIPQTRAKGQRPHSETIAAFSADVASLVPVSAAAPAQKTVSDTPAMILDALTTAQTQVILPTQSELAISSALNTPITVVAVLAPRAEPVLNVAPTAEQALKSATTDNAVAVLAATPPSKPSGPVPPKAADVASIKPLTDKVTQSSLPSEAQLATLAWSGDGEETFDPVSLSAIQSFMTESELATAQNNSGQIRDGINALLAEVPCARLQVEFRPDTGRLELRGHIPQDGLRAPVLDALRAQIGTSIPVDDNLLILPRPQCGALAGIAGMGLPQSTDQRTNPRLIGADTHARVYAFTEGQRLILDMTAPDYDAYIYIDYFDAEGNVIHLTPNEVVSLEKQPAKSALQVGADRQDGNFLAVTVSPPYGQEIAVAYAASTPLYDGVRPTVENAETYLTWLQDRVSDARAKDDTFKGEWVYFFVSTAAR